MKYRYMHRLVFLYANLILSNGQCAGSTGQGQARALAQWTLGTGQSSTLPEVVFRIRGVRHFLRVGYSARLIGQSDNRYQMRRRLDDRTMSSQDVLAMPPIKGSAIQQLEFGSHLSTCKTVGEQELCSGCVLEPGQSIWCEYQWRSCLWWAARQMLLCYSADPCTAQDREDAPFRHCHHSNQVGSKYRTAH